MKKEELDNLEPEKGKSENMKLDNPELKKGELDNPEPEEAKSENTGTG